MFGCRTEGTDEAALFLSSSSAIFPGYYTGRATHVHVRLHTEWETLKNGTFRSNRMIHTGQIFVPDNINAQIDKVRYPLSLSHSTISDTDPSLSVTDRSILTTSIRSQTNGVALATGLIRFKSIKILTPMGTIPSLKS